MQIVKREREEEIRKGRRRKWEDVRERRTSRKRKGKGIEKRGQRGKKGE